MRADQHRKAERESESRFTGGEGPLPLQPCALTRVGAAICLWHQGIH